MTSKSIALSLYLSLAFSAPALSVRYSNTIHVPVTIKLPSEVPSAQTCMRAVVVSAVVAIVILPFLSRIGVAWAGSEETSTQSNIAEATRLPELKEISPLEEANLIHSKPNQIGIGVDRYIDNHIAAMIKEFGEDRAKPLIKLLAKHTNKYSKYGRTSTHELYDILLDLESMGGDADRLLGAAGKHLEDEHNAIVKGAIIKILLAFGEEGIWLVEKLKERRAIPFHYICVLEAIEKHGYNTLKVAKADFDQFYNSLGHLEWPKKKVRFAKTKEEL